MYSLNLVYVVILRVFTFVELLVNYTIRMGNFPLCGRNYTEKMGRDIAVDLKRPAFSTA